MRPLVLKTVVILTISPPSYLATEVLLLMPLAAAPVACAAGLTIAVAIPNCKSIIAALKGILPSSALCGLRI
jgi:hypothetical protein